MSQAPPSAFKSFVAGGVGGGCVVVVGQPLDTIKVRLQTMPKPAAGESPLYKGTADCAMKTIRNEGFFGLYKGMGAPLLGVTPMFAVCFFGFNLGKRLQQKDANTELTKIQIGLAGGLSGVFTTGIMVPGERIKCLLQVQADSKGPPKYAGPVDVVRQLYKEGGVRSLYRGTGATLLRDVPGSMAYFGGYEITKDWLTPAGGSKSDLRPLQVMTAGGLAGCFNWLIALPADVLKSRLQTAPAGKYPNGIRSVFSELMASEGILGLYKGITPVMLRAFPANAACFMGYELTIKLLNYLIP